MTNPFENDDDDNPFQNVMEDRVSLLDEEVDLEELRNQGFDNPFDTFNNDSPENDDDNSEDYNTSSNFNYHRKRSQTLNGTELKRRKDFTPLEKSETQQFVSKPPRRHAKSLINIEEHETAMIQTSMLHEHEHEQDSDKQFSALMDSNPFAKSHSADSNSSSSSTEPFPADSDAQEGQEQKESKLPQPLAKKKCVIFN